MNAILERFSEIFSRFTDWTFVLAALLVVGIFTDVYYYLLRFLKNNNAGLIANIFLAVFFTAALAVILAGGSIDGIAFILVPILFLLFVALVYGQELRRRVFMKTSIRAEEKDRSINEEEALRCSDEIIKALQAMSKNDIGALIVLSNENVPAQILESGTRLNSDISAELIEGIFIPKAPLHDGAMIVSGTKIVAAGCFLPISEAENIPKDLGTRHRAAIGITEMIDVTVLIVSEETGIISVVSAGKMKRYADTEMLKNTLKRFYWQDMGRI